MKLNLIVIFLLSTVTLYSKADHFESFLPEDNLRFENTVKSIDFSTFLSPEEVVLPDNIKKIIVTGEASNKKWSGEYEFNTNKQLIYYNGTLVQLGKQYYYTDNYSYTDGLVSEYSSKRGESLTQYKYKYNKAKLLLYFEDTKGNMTEYIYNNRGELLEDRLTIDNENTYSGKYLFNENKKLVKYQRIKNQDNKVLFTISYEYNKSNPIRIWKKNEYGYIEYEKLFTYHENGNLKTVTLLRSNELDSKWTYSDKNKLIEYISYPSGDNFGSRWFGIDKYYYNDNDKLIKKEQLNYETKEIEDIKRYYYVSIGENVTQYLTDNNDCIIYAYKKDKLKEKIFYTNGLYSKKTIDYNNNGKIKSIIESDINNKITGFENFEYISF